MSCEAKSWSSWKKPPDFEKRFSLTPCPPYLERTSEARGCRPSATEAEVSRNFLHWAPGPWRLGFPKRAALTFHRPFLALGGSQKYRYQSPNIPRSPQRGNNEGRDGGSVRIFPQIALGASGRPKLAPNRERRGIVADVPHRLAQGGRDKFPALFPGGSRPFFGERTEKTFWTCIEGENCGIKRRYANGVKYRRQRPAYRKGR